MSRQVFDASIGESREMSEDEIEGVDFVICLQKSQDPGNFKDNLTGHCSDCGCEVIFRPNAPKRPPRLCQECAMKLVTDASDKTRH